MTIVQFPRQELTLEDVYSLLKDCGLDLAIEAHTKSDVVTLRDHLCRISSLISQIDRMTPGNEPELPLP